MRASVATFRGEPVGTGWLRGVESADLHHPQCDRMSHVTLKYHHLLKLFEFWVNMLNHEVV
jgi:hypothetical protein